MNNPFGATAAERYDQLQNDRQPYIDRARQLASLSMPFLMPEQGTTGSTAINSPWQNLGARGVRTLASKLQQALFPPEPFFKYLTSDAVTQQLAQANGAGDPVKGEIELALNARERAIMREVDASQFRVASVPTFMHLLVTGNHLIHIPIDFKPPDTGRVRTWRLDQYVVRRDPTGQVLEFVIEEETTAASLPESGRRFVKDPNSTDTVLFYTHVYRDPENPEDWIVYQEIDGQIVPETQGNYKDDAFPYIVARLNAQPGEHYGRSYLEEFHGDLSALDSLSKDLLENSAACARTVFMVDPAGSTSLKAVAEAQNLDVIAGSSEEVSTLRVDKAADLRVTEEAIQRLSQSLAYSFLLNTAVQRPQERVTAEEIRYVAAELDSALGGMYTVLGADLQLPAVKVFEQRAIKAQQLPEIPKDLASPVIVTGLQALSRGSEQRNLKAWLSDVAQVLGPEQTFTEINLSEFVKRSAAAYGIDTFGLLKTAEQKAQEQQQAQMMAMVQQLGPQAIQQMGGMAQEAMKNPAGVSNIQAQAAQMMPQQ